jgi:hypothetical protein
LKGLPVKQWGLLKSPLVRLLLWARAAEAGTTFPSKLHALGEL